MAPGANLLQSTAWTLIIFALFAVPGYVFAFLNVDRIGHRRLQWIGFSAMAICFGLIGFIPGLTHVIVPFLLIYGISYFFTEFGPNVTTFLIPTEVFGVGERTTGHGIAAGVGKLGAFLGVFLFPVLSSALGLGGVLIFCSALGAGRGAADPGAPGEERSQPRCRHLQPHGERHADCPATPRGGFGEDSRRKVGRVVAATAPRRAAPAVPPIAASAWPPAWRHWVPARGVSAVAKIRPVTGRHDRRPG